jgi:hypothetical protein
MVAYMCNCYNGDSQVPNIRYFLENLCESIGGKWDSLRDYLAMKGIILLVLCRVEGKERLVNGIVVKEMIWSVIL